MSDGYIFSTGLFGNYKSPVRAVVSLEYDVELVPNGENAWSIVE